MSDIQYLFNNKSVTADELFAQAEAYAQNRTAPLRISMTIEEPAPRVCDNIRFHFFAQTLSIATRVVSHDTLEITYVARAPDDNFNTKRARQILRGRFANIHRPKVSAKVKLVDRAACEALLAKLSESCTNLFSERPEGSRSKHAYKNRRNRQFFPQAGDPPELVNDLADCRRKIVEQFREGMWALTRPVVKQ